MLRTGSAPLLQQHTARSASIVGAERTISPGSPFLNRAKLSFAFNDRAFSDRTLVLLDKDSIHHKGLSTWKEPGTTQPTGEEGEAHANIMQIDNSSPDTAFPPFLASELARYHVHSIILAAESPFFKALFSNGFRESGQRVVYLEIDKDDLRAFEAMLLFLYTGSFDYRSATSKARGANDFHARLLPTIANSSSDEEIDLLQVMLVAHKFAVHAALAGAAERLVAEHIFTLDDVNSVFALPDLLIESNAESEDDMTDDTSSCGFHAVVERCIATLEEAFAANFEVRWQCEEFLRLVPRALEALLRSDTLAVRSENTIWRALELWVDAGASLGEAELREQEFVRLVRSVVRFPHIETAYLMDVVCHASPRRLAHCMDLVEEAKQYHLGTEERRSELEEASAENGGRQRYTPRTGFFSGADQFIYGWSVDALTSLAEGDYRTSPPFYYNGYAFYVRLGRADNAAELFLHLDKKMSRVGPKFFARMQYWFEAENRTTGRYDILERKTIDTFNHRTSGWGYTNIFGMEWGQMEKSCKYWLGSGKMNIRVCLR